MWLKETNYHKEKGVGTQSSKIGVVQLAGFQKLFEYKDKWFNDFIFCEKFLDKTNAF